MMLQKLNAKCNNERSTHETATSQHTIKKGAHNWKKLTIFYTGISPFHFFK